MSSLNRSVAARAALLCSLVAFAFTSQVIAQSPPCVVPDNGTGTVTLPPIGCEYLSPSDVHTIVNGLPPGTTIELAPIHKNFICSGEGQISCSFPIPPGLCEVPGGSQGGHLDCFNSAGEFELTGTGALAGFHRSVTLPLACEVHTGPRTPGAPVQAFPSQMMRLQGQITGDPDFDLLRITGGSSFGLPSPGHTTLTQLPGGDWAVDSFFDITYRIDFVGAPGGPLGGMSGSTTATIHMVAQGPGGGPGGACCLPSGMCIPATTAANCFGSGGVSFFPGLDCSVAPCSVQADVCCYPDGTCQDIDPNSCQATGGQPYGPGLSCQTFDCPPSTEACCLGTAAGGCIETTPTDCQAQGGTPQGPNTNCDTVTCDTGCAPLPGGAGCSSTVCQGTGAQCVPVCVTYDPTTGSTVVNDCACLPANHCRARLPGGGSDDGDGGATPRGGDNPCVVSDNGGGTVTLPPAGCAYLSADEVHMIIDGLPPGTTIELAPIHQNFICHEGGGNNVCSFGLPPGVCEQLGGSLGGHRDCFNSDGDFEINGTGTLAGFNRSVSIPLACEIHTGPRTPGDPVQSFDTQMFRMFGQITGDPDFDLLRIVAGTDFGLPSPGHTTLTQLPGGNWAVDSFFDITYRIDFVGKPGGPLSGMSGSTTGTIRMFTGRGGPTCEGVCPPGFDCNQSTTVTANGQIQSCCFCTESTRACCLPTGGCVDLSEGECIGFGGTPQAAGTSCATVNCPEPPDCAPTAAGDACQPTACPSTSELCVPTCVRVDPTTGSAQVISCECRSPNECHAQIVGGGDTGGGDGGDPRGPGSNPCVVTDNGGGTVTLPPAGCEYLSADEVHEIIDGLPPGTTIEFATIHKDFICREQPGTPTVCSFAAPIPGVDCEDAGGSLGGDKECSDSILEMNLNGTGTLAGYNRVMILPLQFETHVGPRTPGDPVQSFDTDMFRMFGQITGDPDFDLLRVVGGTDFGYPSPGHTTLTQLPGGNWAVDSFFDITYRIDFVGAPGGPLAGMSGSTTGTIRMATGRAATCVGGCPPGTICHESRVVDPATGLIDICCECIDEPTDCQPTPDGDGCQPTNCPNSSEVCLPTCVNYNPETGATTVVSCDCRSPNFCHAQIQGGGDTGGGDGEPRGPGSNPCVVTDNGGGTVTLPPIGCEYLSPDDVHRIVDGLPAGTTIELAPIHRNFICGGDGQQSVCSALLPPGECEQDGGSLGGKQDCFSSEGAFQLTGTGALAGFIRTASIPLSCEVHTAPRTPGAPVQSFDTDMFRMFGQITGDPDFDLLRFVGGTDFGLPSPGHTTLTQLPGGNWAVDSFFDITYRIDFVGKPGGPLSGMSGSTTGTIRMATGRSVVCVGGCPTGTICHETRIVNADGSITTCCDCVPTTEACCLPTGGCVDLDPAECVAFGGTPQGVNTNCANTECQPQDCGPTANGDGCVDVVCPNADEVCVPTCFRFDPTTGQAIVTDCECRGVDDCRAVLSGGSDGGPGDGGSPRGPNPCVVTDNGGGTVTLPPAGCEYLSPDDVHRIIDGLPPGTTIELAPIHKDFICREHPGAPTVCSFTAPIPGVDCEDAGGTLGGDKECSDSILEMSLNGTGALAGFNRTAIIPLQFETHVGPRTPGDPVQSFDTDMFRMFGQITGDPDFDLLRVVGGTDFGYPSPGHTTLTQLPGGNWAVDSFFDITYRIDFVGAPGGPLAGMSGSTTATIRMATGSGPPPSCEGVCPVNTVCERTVLVNPDGSIDICCNCVPLQGCSCPGDVNGDGFRNGADIQAFVDCILGTGVNCACADVNEDGVVDMNDIPPFVSILLFQTGPCP